MTKSFITFNNAVLPVFFFCLVARCLGGADVDVAPMEKTEKEALYSAVQGFVGNWWNGSGLYPDPCGWTPIQVLFAPTYLYCGIAKLPLSYISIGKKNRTSSVCRSQLKAIEYSSIRQYSIWTLKIMAFLCQRNQPSYLKMESES